MRDNSWLYSLKPGDRVIVNYGGQSYYKTAVVSKIKVKEGVEKEGEIRDKSILIYIKNSNEKDASVDVFKDGRRKMGKYASDEVLYEYNDFNYQEFILLPHIIKTLNDFDFWKIGKCVNDVRHENGKVLLFEIYNKLKDEMWL